MAISPCNKELDFIFLLNRLVIYSLPTAMSFLTENHTMDLFLLNFINLLFGLLITGKSFENLSYLSSCSLSQKWRFSRLRSKVLLGIEPDLACTKVSMVASQYLLWSGSLWYPLISGMVKNKGIFSLVIWELMPAFSLWLYNLVLQKIISINTSSQNNSRSLTGGTISSSVQNLGTFAHSARLISRFAYFTSKTSEFG